MVTGWGHTGAQRFQANYMVLQQAISSDRYYIIAKRKESFRTETEHMKDCSLYRHIMRKKMIKKGTEAVGGTEKEGSSLSQKTHQSAKNLCSMVSPPVKRSCERVKKH